MKKFCMRKIISVLTIVLAMAAIVSLVAYAEENDTYSERRERETFTDYVEIEIETLEGVTWIENWPGVLPDETQAPIEVEPAPEPTWEERGITMSLEGVFDFDIQKKITRVIQQSVNASLKENSENVIFAVAPSGEIVSDTEITLRKEDVEAIATIYFEKILSMGTFGNDDIRLFSVRYDEENSVWVCIFDRPIDWSDKPETYIHFDVFSCTLFFSETGELLRFAMLS